MIERNIARIALPKMLVGLFVARVDDDQMEESRETTKKLGAHGVTLRLISCPTRTWAV